MANIHQAVLIGASVEKVYHAITSQEGLSGWWTPGVEAKAIVNSIARFPFGDEYFKKMEITELKPFESVKWNCLNGDDEWVGTSLSFELLGSEAQALSNSHPEVRGQLEQQANTEVTLLIFQHNNWKKETLMFAECSYTWGQFLCSLKLLCESGKGRPWPHQHQVEK